MILGLCGVAGSGKDTVADILVKERGFVKIALADPLKRICKDVFQFTDEQLWGSSEKRNEPDKRYTHRTEHWWERAYDFDTDDLHYSYWRCTHCRTVIGEVTGAGHPSTSTRLIPCTCLTPRHALQQLGTEWGRACYPDVWVDYAMRVAKELDEGGYVYNPKRGLESEYGHPRAPQYPYVGVVISDVRFKNEVDAIKKQGGKVWRIVRPGAGLEGAHLSETEQCKMPDSFFDFVIYNESSMDALREAVLGVKL